MFVFPGYTASAEAAAFYYTHGRFERLADRDGFIVVYGNGLPEPAQRRARNRRCPRAAFFRAAWRTTPAKGSTSPTSAEILGSWTTELKIDRSRIYATGLSAGGGMAFQLALEAPDLVAAIAPVAPPPLSTAGAAGSTPVTRSRPRARLHRDARRHP